MDSYEFQQYAAEAWVRMFVVGDTGSGRAHVGFDLPDGGRLYFEWRGGRNHE